jgi:hypothetical protein
MDLRVIFTGILGLTLIISPVIVGAHYLSQWRSDEHRLERRMRDIE